MNRREFIGGASLAAVSLVGCRPVRNSSGQAKVDRPLLRLGVISDVHHNTKDDGKGEQNCLCFEPALRYFDACKADGILVCGDLSDIGTVDSLRAIGRIWDHVFPGGKRSDGEPVANLMHFGDHDMGAYMHKYRWASKVCLDPTEVERIIPENNPARIWEECFHEKWAPIQIKTVKGYQFVLAHHPLHTAESKNGNRIPGLADFLASQKFDPSRPFFYSQHRHFEVGDTEEILSKYPNVIAFHGHLHRNCCDELNLTQGAFPKISVPSINYCCTRGGHENSFGKSGYQLMNRVSVRKTWQGMFVTVYADRIVVARRDFLHGLPLGPDWVIPLPSPDPSLRLETRKAKSVPPQFAPSAKASWRICREKDRKNHLIDQVRVSFPVAHASGQALRAFDYEVVAFAENSPLKKKYVFSPHCHWADAKDVDPVECAFALSELPKDYQKTIRFEITPRDSFGNRGKTISCLSNSRTTGERT